MPVDVSKCSCDDPVELSRGRKWSRQHAGIDILGYDGISDNGEEVYNFCAQEGIKNIVIMGVHTNMCVLGRSFGIRQMTRLGKNVALARDLTDAMYDPRQPPYVSHSRGTPTKIESLATGSLAKTSSTAPPSLPSLSAATSAVSSTVPPRDVLIRIAPGFIRASAAPSSKLRVDGSKGTCTLTTSLVASNVARSIGVAPSSRHAG